MQRIFIDNHDRILYYSNPAGYIAGKEAVVDTMFQTQELERFLQKQSLTIRWEDGVYDRLLLGQRGGRFDPEAPPLKSCRVWQLTRDSPINMRFIPYEALLERFGQPDRKHYETVYDGLVGTNDPEEIYTLFRDPVPGYPDAMSLLLGDDLGGSYPAAKEKVPAPAKPFVLPPQSESMRRVYAYLLQKRCIDREILNSFVRKRLIYESCERSKDGTKEYHNAVFVGFDEHGVPRHGHKRGLYTMGQSYRGNIEGSDPRHSFHYLGGDDTLYVFEAPIDLLSYISLFPEGWQEHNYVACCGTSSIPVMEMLRQLPQLRQVYLCLDNDAAGHAASERMAALLEEHDLNAVRLVPQQKDWNDDLKAEQENNMERSELCQTFC